jgi:hypothetical protein
MTDISTIKSTLSSTSSNVFSLGDKLGILEGRLNSLGTGTGPIHSTFSEGTMATEQSLNPTTTRKDIASLEYRIELLDSRIGAESLKFGSVILQSYADTSLFVNDHIPSKSYGCFFDLVALLDGIQDPYVDMKTFVDAQYSAQRSNFMGTMEASTSASFLHIVPLCFCTSKADSATGQFGSVEKNFPLVKDRECWSTQGGAFGLKKQLQDQIPVIVQSIQNEIHRSLGSSKGAELAQQFLMDTHQCFNDFFAWTESFFLELQGMSRVKDSEAWKLVLECWLAFFHDLYKIRVECSLINLHSITAGSLSRAEVISLYIWTMGRAIRLQNEYRSKNFRNHPTISTVINYHLFQHRVPLSSFEDFKHKVEKETQAQVTWKGQVTRDVKKLMDKVKP